MATPTRSLSLPVIRHGIISRHKPFRHSHLHSTRRPHQNSSHIASNVQSESDHNQTSSAVPNHKTFTDTPSSSKLSTSNSSVNINTQRTMLTMQILQQQQQQQHQQHDVQSQTTPKFYSEPYDNLSQQYPHTQHFQNDLAHNRPSKPRDFVQSPPARQGLFSPPNPKSRRYPQFHNSQPSHHKINGSSRRQLALTSYNLQRMSAEGIRRHTNDNFSNTTQPRLSDSAADPLLSTKRFSTSTRKSHHSIQNRQKQRNSNKAIMLSDSQSAGQLPFPSDRNDHLARASPHNQHLAAHLAAVNAKSSANTNAFNFSNTDAPVQSLTALTDAHVQSNLQLQSSHQPNPHMVHQPVRSLTVQPDSASRARFLVEVGPDGAIAHSANLSTARPQPSRQSIPETIRRPILYFAKYGSPNTWATDVFTLPHNAIRAECIDLYNILESIHARGRQVCIVELEEFYMWWATFELFIIEYFDFEADILFPWVFSFPPSPNVRITDDGELVSRVPKPKPSVDVLMRNSLLARKEVLLDGIRQLNGTFELRRHVDTTDVFETILEEVNHFVPKMLEYFHAQERHLPQLAAQLYSPSSKDVIARKYVQYIRRGESPQINLVLLTRWMDTEHRDKWVRAHVRGYGRLMYRRWERKCEKSHSLIAVRFHKRLQRSVRSVAASRLRRRTEFGEEIDDISFGSFPSHGGSIRSLSLAVGNRGFNKSRETNSRSSDTHRSKSKLRS